MSFREKIAVDVEQLIHKIQFWRSAGDTIVFTNGVFDLIHLGHVSYLETARSKGDRLVVGINSDLSVKQNKGNERPINTIKSRTAVVAALESVDAVIVFAEKTPLTLIKKILPDVLVKGADYAIKDIVGGVEVIANGGKVLTVKLEDGYSSTQMIETIKNLGA